MAVSPPPRVLDKFVSQFIPRGFSFIQAIQVCFRKQNQALCNEIEELKNKLQKVTDDLSKINMADTRKRNCHQEKRIQLNLCQANMATSSASKWKLRGKFRSSSQELTKFQSVCAIILGNLSKPQKRTVINSTLLIVVSGDKDVHIMGDFNIDLLKCESSQISQDFLLSLQSCYLIPTVDQPTRVHRTSATLIVNNPDKLLSSGNIISDISDHFSQFCIQTKMSRSNSVDVIVVVQMGFQVLKVEKESRFYLEI